MPFKKSLSIILFSTFFVAIFAVSSMAQERERVVPENKSRTKQKKEKRQRQIPTLQNKIIVKKEPLVKKTSSSRPTNAPALPRKKMGFSSAMRTAMLKSIQKKLGAPYRYGTSGPGRYDCSGFVWSVFGDIGIDFTRTSASTFWRNFEPVKGEDCYKFGTLVFFNRLGHVGIVVDENGFYHASRSKGVTYSKFKGYWEKRITGFRRVQLENYIY